MTTFTSHNVHTTVKIGANNYRVSGICREGAMPFIHELTLYGQRKTQKQIATFEGVRLSEVRTLAAMAIARGVSAPAAVDNSPSLAETIAARDAFRETMDAVENVLRAGEVA